MHCLEGTLLLPLLMPNGFELIKDTYINDPDFGVIFADLPRLDRENYYISQGYLIFKDKLCIPSYSMHELLVRKVHGGGLMGYFGVAKILSILQEHFYWSKMRRDVERITQRCVTCHHVKSKVNSYGLTLYYLFLVFHGLIYLWTLYLHYLELGMDIILFM